MLAPSDRFEREWIVEEKRRGEEVPITAAAAAVYILQRDARSLSSVRPCMFWVYSPSFLPLLLWLTASTSIKICKPHPPHPSPCFLLPAHPPNQPFRFRVQVRVRLKCSPRGKHLDKEGYEGPETEPESLTLNAPSVESDFLSPRKTERVI